MFTDVDSVQLLFNTNVLLLISGIIILLAATYFVYKITIPQISPKIKVFLISVRVIILSLILVLIFEPVLKISRSNDLEPATLIFIDNTNSIILNDSTESYNKIASLISGLTSEIDYEKRIFSFGTAAKFIESDSIFTIDFREKITNIENVFNQIGSETGNVTGAIIVSDGIINNGNTSLSNIDKLGLPLYTIGIGDTTKRNNLQIKKIIKNRFIYSEKETEIEVVILNSGLGGSSNVIHIYEGNKLLESKNIVLNESGINRVTFSYFPETSGEKKIRISADYLSGEFTAQDNYKTTYISVLNNKLNISIVAGSPSPDLAFIKSSLDKDDNLSVNDFTQISGSKFSNPDFNQLDSADILFLVGFPAKNTPPQLINKITSLINDSGKPFFFLQGVSTDFSKLSQMKNVISFNYRNLSKDVVKVQPVISNVNTGILKINSKIDPRIWSNLAPVNSFDINYSLNPGSVMIASAKSGNRDTGIPILISSSIGANRSISMLCFDIWKWKLSSNEDNKELFDQFLSNVIKWLNIDRSKKRFTINTSRRVFTRGEPVDFTAELYDDLYQPVNNADVYLEYDENGNKRKVFFEPVNDGIYEATLTSNIPGDIKFTAFAFSDKLERERFYGNITIDEKNLESVNLQMDKSFLMNISNNTGGKYASVENADQIISNINSYNSGKIRLVSEENEYKFWTNEWILIIIILLFGIEWFIRKRMGML